jgi:hypothetical protein
VVMGGGVQRLPPAADGSGNGNGNGFGTGR